MSAEEIVRRQFKGFVTPDPRIDGARPWPTHSSYTQTGPYLDVPKPMVRTNMVLQASGEIDSPVSMILRAQRGGMPKMGGAGFVWRDSTDEGNKYRGWDAYAHMSGTSTLGASDLAGGTPEHDHFGGRYTIGRDIVTCFQRVDDVLPNVYTRSRINGVWQAPVLVYSGTSSSFELYPAILELPNQKLLLFHWVLDSATDTSTIRMWWSEDSGASWSLGQYNVLPEPIDRNNYMAKRIAVEYLNGQVSIIVHLLSMQEDTLQAFRDVLVQYASNDLGASCTEVLWWESEATTQGAAEIGEASRGYPVIVPYQGSLMVFFLGFGKVLTQTDTTDTPFISPRPFFVRIGSAYDPLNLEKVQMVRAQGQYLWADIDDYLTEEDPNYFNDADLTGLADENGIIYLYGRLSDSQDRAVTARTADGGETWQAMGDVVTGYKEVPITINFTNSYSRASDEVIGIAVGDDVASYNSYINYTVTPLNGLEYPDHVPINPDPSRTILSWKSVDGTTYSVACNTYNASGTFGPVVSRSTTEIAYSVYVDDGKTQIQFVYGHEPIEGSEIQLSYDYAIDTIFHLVIDGIALDVAVPWGSTDNQAESLIRLAIKNHPVIGTFIFPRQLTPSDTITLVGRIKGYDFSTFVGDGITIGSSTQPVERKGSWYYANENTYARSLYAVLVDSRVLMLHKTTAGYGGNPASGYPDALQGTWLGGYTSHTMPGRADNRDEAGQLQWDFSWRAWNLPQYDGWTEYASGSETLNDDSTMDVDQRYYGRTWANEASNFSYGALIHGIVKPDPLETDLNKCPFIDLVLCNGTVTYHVSVLVSSTAIRVKNKLTAEVTDFAFASNGSHVEMLVSMSTGNVYVWARLYTEEVDQIYEPVAVAVSITSLAAVVNSGMLWGSVLSNYSSNWRAADYLRLRSGFQLPSNGFSNPEDLYTKQISTNRSSPTPFPQGAQLVALSGPAYIGDYWLLQTLYRYPVSNLGSVLRPSPRDSWRSVGLTEQRIAYLLSSTSSAPTRLFTGAIGVHAGAVNFRTFRLEGMISDGSWVTIRTFDMAAGLSGLAYTRAGNAIMPASSAGYGVRNVFDQALAGRVIDLGGGAYRKLADNSGGAWTGSSTETMATPTLILEDGDGSEPASGTCSIWSRDLGAVIFTTTPYVALRFVVPAQSNVDGYFEAGNLWAGPVSFLGQPYSNNWSLEEAGSNVEIVDMPDFRDIVRELGPSRRTWSLSWSDSVNQSEVLVVNPQARYLTHKVGGAPLGLVCDTPRQLQGLMRRLKGPMTPALFFASLETTAGDVDLAITTDRDQMMFCRVMGPVVRENVWGDENTTELQRVSSFHLREIS